ncbi:unnamed protein product [Didymodactylos carnosus]|uniref:Decapping nuclease n=1 Tax=Didymodactylos carnosus TaxID=1234261 RepID=A0A815RNG6_9BILA|nr:unnamed protein product [Didymodactylos carnosus]CAF1523689.1 unnamed protein product [Didymodactylos carnosus]CAF4310529.1 unnamed protein product [Didymodactylos carnosus]CAF4344847.1 unnamed protein product [Didymodactylos carnosus]
MAYNVKRQSAHSDHGRNSGRDDGLPLSVFHRTTIVNELDEENSEDTLINAISDLNLTEENNISQTSATTNSLNVNLVDMYNPIIVGTCNVSWRLPKEHMNIENYKKCLRIPGEPPRYSPPTHIPFSLPSARTIYIQYPPTSLLPLLITASTCNVNISNYNFVTERGNFNKIMMCDEMYSIGIIKIDNTIYLRRYVERKNMNKGDIGFQFEKVCTHSASFTSSTDYYNLISGKIGHFNVLLLAETDAIDTNTERYLELKCSTRQNKRKLWTQSFLGGITSIIIGRRSSDNQRIDSLLEHKTDELLEMNNKEKLMRHLYKILNFLSTNVEENQVYLFSRFRVLKGVSEYNQNKSSYRLKLCRITSEQDLDKYTFMTKSLLSQLPVPLN